MIVEKTKNFEKWLLKLKDKKAIQKIVIRIEKIKRDNNLGDWKSLRNGLFELRIDYAVGYRIYFTYKGNTIIVLLVGGDKSTQQKDINKAREELKCLQ